MLIAVRQSFRQRVPAATSLMCRHLSSDPTTPTAIVTGGAKGIGEAIVRRLAADGYKVFIADVDEEKGSALQAELDKATFEKVDVTDPRQVEMLVQETVKLHGHLSVMVNNAAIVGSQGLLTADYPIDAWKQVIDVNLNGVFYGCKYALAAMRKQRSGVVINMSSFGGIIGYGGLAPYTACKGGIISLTRALAVEYAQFGIRVNSVAPAAVMTPMMETYIAASADPKATAASIIQNNLIEDFIRPVHVANVVAWLISSEARFITGQTLPVDAGTLAAGHGAKALVAVPPET